MDKTLQRFFCVAFTAIIFFTANPVSAVTRTWNLSGGGAWNVAANWNPAAIPIAGDVLTIDPAAAATITNVPTLSLASLTIGGTNNKAITFTSTAAATLTVVAVTVTGATGASLTLSTNNNLSITGAGSIGAAGALTVNTGSTLTVSGASGNLAGAGSLNVLGTLANNSQTANGISTTTVAFYGGGLYSHLRNGGAVPTATWTGPSTAKFTGITTTAPTNINQNFFDFTWDCAQTATLTLGISVGFAVQNNLTVSRTTSTISTASAVTDNGNVGTALILFNESSVTRTFNIGYDLVVDNTTNLFNAFLVLSNGTGSNPVTFNIGDDIVTRSNVLSTTLSIRISQSINVRPCTLNVASDLVVDSRTLFRVLDPGANAGCSAALNVVKNAHIGETGRSAATDYALFQMLWWGAAASDNQTASAVFGTAGNASQVNLLDNGQVFMLQDGTGTQNTSNLSLTINGSLYLKGTGANLLSPKSSFTGLGTSNAGSAANTLTVNIKKVSGADGNIFMQGTGGFAPYLSAASVFGGSSSGVTMNVEGSFVATNATAVADFMNSSGSSNTVTLNISEALTLSGPTATFAKGSGTNNVCNVSAASFTCMGGIVNGSSVSGGTGNTFALGVTGNFMLANGTLNWQANTTGSTTNTASATIGGNFQFVGGTLNMNPATSDNLVGSFAVAGNVSLINGTIRSSASANVLRRGTITFNGTSQQLVISGTATQTDYIDYIINSGSTVTIPNGGTLQGSLAVNGALVFPSVPVTLVLGGLLSGTGSISLQNAPHTLALASLGSNSIGSIITNGKLSSVAYTGLGAQSIMPVTYEHLKLLGSGLKTFSGTTTVTNNLYAETAAASLGASAITVTVSGDVYLNGSILSFGTTAAQNLNLYGNVHFGTLDMATSALAHVLTLRGNPERITLNTTGNTGGTVIYDKTGDQLVQGGTYYNLTIGGSGLKTTNGSLLTVTSLLTLNGGGLLAQDANDPSSSSASGLLRIGSGATIQCSGGYLGNAPACALSTHFYDVIYTVSQNSYTELSPSVGLVRNLILQGGIQLNLSAPATLGSAATSGQLQLGTNGILTLGNSVLTINRNAANPITGTFGSLAGQIVCNGTGALNLKLGTSGSNYNAVYPLSSGSGSYNYTPVVINITAGTIANEGLVLRAVGSRHPVTGSNAASKYFIVRTAAGWTGISGTINYTYLNAEVTGTQASYIGKYLNTRGTGQWSANGAVVSNGGSTPNFNVTFTYTATSSFSGIYTAGEAAAFPSGIYYSKTNGNWGTSGTFVTDGYSGSTVASPGSSDYVLIGNNRTVNLNANNIQTAGLLIDSTGILEAGTTTGHNFGNVSGDGTLQYTIASGNPVFPGGSWTDFNAATSNSTISFAGTGNYVLPSSLSTYNNIKVSGGGTKTAPGSAVTIRKTLNVGTVSGAATAIVFPTDVTFSGEGINVINMANGSAGTITQVSGTAYFDGAGMQTINAGNTDQIFAFSNINIGNQTALNLSGGGSANAFTLAGNLSVNSKLARGLMSESGYSGFSFISSGTVSASNGALIGFTDVAIALGAVVNNSADWSIRRNLLNNGTLNCTAGTVYWGCGTGCTDGLLYSAAGSPVTTFNDLTVSVSGRTQTIAVNTTVNGTLTIGRFNSGHAGSLILPADYNAITLTINNLNVWAGSLALGTPSAQSTTHTVFIKGNADLFSDSAVSVNLVKTSGSFTNQANLTFNGSAAKNINGGSSVNNILYVNDMIFSAGIGNMLVDAAGNFSVKGNFTANSSNPIIFNCGPKTNSTLRLTLIPATTKTIGGSGTGTLILPNFSIGSSGSSITLSRSIYLSGCNTGGTTWNTAAFGLQGSLVNNAAISLGTNTVTFIGQGNIVNESGDVTKFAAGSSTFVFAPCGSTSILSAFNFNTLTLNGSISMATGLLNRAVTLNAFDKSIFMNTSELRVSGSVYTSNPNGLSATNGTISNGIYSNSVTTLVEYNGTGPQLVSGIGYVNLTLSGGATAQKLLAGNSSVSANLINNAYFQFGNTAYTLTTSADVIGTGTYDMSSAAHLWRVNGINNAIGKLITGPNYASTITYGAGSAQQVFGSANYRNLNMSGGGTKTLTGDVTLGGILNMSAANVQLNTYNLTIGTSADEVGQLTYTAGQNAVCNSTGAFRRWFAETGLPLAAGSTGLFPIQNASGQDRSVYLIFSSAKAFGVGGLISVSHTDIVGVSPLAVQQNDAGYLIDNRSKSNWVFSTPSAPVLSSGNTIGVQINGEGSCYPPSNASAQLLRVVRNTGTVPAGTNLVVAASSKASPAAARTGWLLSDLTAGAYYIGGNAADLPINIWIATSTNGGAWTTGSNWDLGTQPGTGGITPTVIIPSGTNITLNANVSINSISVDNGATLSTDVYTITLAGGTINNIKGTLNTGNTSAKAIYGLSNSSFDIVTNTSPSAGTVLVNTSQLVNYNGSGGQTVQGLAYTALTLSGTNRSGNLTLESGASISVNNTFLFPATFASGFGYVVTGNTFVFNGTVNQSYTGSFNFHNLTFNNSNKLICLTGTFNIGVAGVFVPGSCDFVSTGNGTLTFNGTTDQAVPNAQYNNLAITSAATPRNITFSATGTIYIQGTFVPSYTNITYISTGSTINFNAAGSLTIPNLPYYNLAFSSTGNRTLSPLTNGPGAIQVAGTFTMGANLIINTGSTFEYNGAGAQTVIAGFPYNHLKVTGARTGSPVITIGASGSTVNVEGDFEISATGAGSFTFYDINLKGSSTQNVTLSSSGIILNNLTVSGTGLKTLASALTIAGGQTLTMSGPNLQLNNFDLTLGQSGTAAVLAGSPLGYIINNGSGRVIKWLTLGSSIPSSAPGAASASQLFHFPLANVNGLPRTVYFTAAAATVSSAGFIAVRYVDGNNTQPAPNTISVNGQAVTRITQGYWDISSSFGSTANLACNIGTRYMFNANDAALLRAATGADATPTSISIPTGTWSGTGSFTGGYLLTSSADLVPATDLNKLYFIGSDGSNFGNSYIASGATSGWNLSSTWYPNGVPDITSSVVIPSATTVTLQNDVLIGYLDLQDGGTFNAGTYLITLANGATHNLNGTLSTANPNGVMGGTNTTITTANSPLISAFGTNAVIDYSSASAQVISSITYNSVTNSGNGPRTVTGTVTIGRNFSPGMGAYTSVGSTIIFSYSGPVTIPPCQYHNIQRSGLGLTTLGTSGGNGGIIGISGALTISGSFSGTGSSLEYNGPGAQTIIANSYNNLIVSNNRGGANITLSPTGTVAVSGTFTNTATNCAFVVTNNTFDYSSGGSQTIAPFGYNILTNTGNGPRTLSSTGIIQISGTWSRGSGAYTIGTSAVEYTGFSSQTIVGGPYYNLLVSGVRGNNVVTFSTGTTISIANSLTATAVFTSGGSYNLAGTTIDFTGAGAQTIPGLPYNNLNNTGNGSRTLGGDISVTGTLNMGSGAFNASTYGVSFIGTGSQAVPALPYYNLSVSQSRGGGAITFPDGVLSVGGALSITATSVSYSVGTNNTFSFNGAGNQTGLNPVPVGFNNLTFATGGTKSFSAATTLAAGKTLTLSGSAQLNNSTANVTLGNGATIIIAGGSMTAAPVFGTGVNISYASTGSAIGFEMPTDSTKLTNLSIGTGSGNDVSTASGNVPVVNGVLTMSSGNLDIRLSGIKIKGTVSGSTAFVKGSNTSTLAVGGTTGGNVGTLAFSPGSNMLGSLLINRKGGACTFTLGADLAVKNSIIFSGGTTCKIATGSNILSYSGTGSIAGEANGHYVTGVLRTVRQINNNVSGETFGGMGLTISACNSCNMDSVTVTRKSGTGKAVVFGSYQGINRVWSITPVNQPASAVNLTMNWISDDDNGAAGSVAKVWKSTNAGVTWKKVLTADAPFSARTRTLSTTSFSDWTIADELSPLPISFLDLYATRNAQAVRVSWQTAQEKSSKEFHVERSSEGSEFTAIGTVKAAGSSVSIKDYSFIDNSEAARVSHELYYRIRMISDDEDKLSAPVSVNAGNEKEGKIALFPNPFTETLYIENSNKGDVLFEITDISGRIVYSKTISAETPVGQFAITQLGYLEAGSYIARITVNGIVEYRKLTKQ
ncbi:MAG: T9SS type A sorting domain-containing protein [Bacteroidota bacterium]